jgi:lysozyme
LFINSVQRVFLNTTPAILGTLHAMSRSMKVTNLRDQLIRDEGVRLFPYKDTVGVLTIGVGRNLDARGISHATAEQMLDEDIAVHTHELLLRHPWIADLDDARKGVMINLAFNLGVAGLSSFKLTLQAVRDGDYHLAAARMLLSKWAHQVGNRADRLALQMSSGQWQ